MGSGLVVGTLWVGSEQLCLLAKGGPAWMDGWMTGREMVGQVKSSFVGFICSTVLDPGASLPSSSSTSLMSSPSGDARVTAEGTHWGELALAF